MDSLGRHSPDLGASRLHNVLTLTFALAFLALIPAVWWYYAAQKREVEAAGYQTTFAVAAGRTTQVASWRAERIGDGRVLMTGFIQQLAQKLLAGRETAAERSEFADFVGRVKGAYAYSGVALVDRNGDIRFADPTDPEQLFQQDVRRQLALQSIQARDAALDDLRLETRTQLPYMILTAPVEQAGAFILLIDPSRFLFPALGTWPGSSSSAETLLVRQEGNDVVYLSKRRDEAAAAQFPRRKLALTLPNESVLASGWMVQSPDYRGIPALGTVRRVPDSNWFLICKMDVAEVDAPLEDLRWRLAFILLLGVLACTSAVGVLWELQQARIHRERERWFVAIANDTPAYLWMASPGEENSFINRPLREFFGTDRSALAADWKSFVHPEDAERVHLALTSALTEGRGYNAEFRLRRYDGEYRRVVAEGARREVKPGEWGLAGSLIDITEQRRAEEELRGANSDLQAELAERQERERDIRALSARLLTVREEERRHLARELHDDVNQQIAAVSIGVGVLSRALPTEGSDVGQQATRIHEKLVQLANDVRRLSHKLHPAMLEYQGLESALRACCSEFSELTKINVAFQAQGAFENVPLPAALCLYRITQEALQNVAKHAQIDSAEVDLAQTDSQLRLKISDRGVGIQGNRQTKASLGLLSIQERARLAGGTATITSGPNGGTQVLVELPFFPTDPPPLG